ncbi:carbohydrate porin [Congregibacter sp.]|uniref:carbohydrate porin n=1 Tax=Congregibacter sp. TaxID=2744308 RepID=UPI003F6C04FF
MGGLVAPQSLGGGYTATNNTGFPYGDNFKTDLAIINWKQTFEKSRWGYAVGRLAFDVYLDPSAVQTPYGGFLNRAFVYSPALGTTGIGALGAVAKGFVTDNVWVGAQIYDANAANGEFDFDTIEEGEFLKAVEIGWTPEFARRGKDRVQFTYWEKDERELAGVSSGSGWAASATSQWNDNLLTFIRAGASDGGAGVAADASASAGFTYQAWEQRSVAFGVGWSEPNADTNGAGLDDEWVVEASYKIQLTRHFSLTPDIQWITNPVRLPDEDDLWIVGVRAILTL